MQPDGETWSWKNVGNDRGTLPTWSEVRQNIDILKTYIPRSHTVGDFYNKNIIMKFVHLGRRGFYDTWYFTFVIWVYPFGLLHHYLKCKWNVFFIAEFERAAKIRKITVYSFLISSLVPEL